MIMKWTKRLKDKWGWDNAKDLYIKDAKCLKRACFHPHDWDHNGHLVCLENANHGCPENCDEL